MLTKEITYTDYDGVERTETFYFNLSKAEIAEMELTYEGGYAKFLERIIKAKDQSQLIKAFKTIILKAYGEKTEDGKHFRKSEALSEAFSQTEAYSELFVDLISNADAASAFVNGIMPKLDVPEDQQSELAEKTKALIESKKSE